MYRICAYTAYLENSNELKARGSLPQGRLKLCHQILVGFADIEVFSQDDRFASRIALNAQQRSAVLVRSFFTIRALPQA